MGAVVIDLQRVRRARQRKVPPRTNVTNDDDLAATLIAEARYAVLQAATPGRGMLGVELGTSSETPSMATKDKKRIAKLRKVAKLARSLVVGAPEWPVSNSGVVEVPLSLIIDMRSALDAAGYDMTSAYRNYDVLGRRAVEGMRLRIDRRIGHLAAEEHATPSEHHSDCG